MDSATHEELLKITDRLRSILARSKTRSVVGNCVAYHLRQANEIEFHGGGLMSPARQIAFLLGLLLSTPEPHKPKEFRVGDWTRCVSLLNQIFNTYQEAMWPDPKDVPNLSEEWRRAREVAGQALLHYHNTGLMATIEQLRNRTIDYVAPFDAFLEKRWGLTAHDALSICDFLLHLWEDHQHSLFAAVKDEKRARQLLIQQWKADGLDIDEVRKRADELGYRATFEALIALLDQTGVIGEEQLTRHFEEKGVAFWRLFTVKRGSIQITYLTEENPVVTHPLILLDDHTAMCPSVNALFQAVLISGEQILDGSSERTRYRRARDKTLENQMEQVARKLFGNSAVYYRGVFESPENQWEHDLIVVYQRQVVIFEAKASPPKEPFRDLEKGFNRLKHAFRGDGGIQKAYEQADRIRRRLEEGEAVDLFDGDGRLQRRLEPDSLEETHMVCVTRDDWGPLAVDLSLLLERSSPDAPYPWAVDILNLQAIADAWDYLNLEAPAFLRFLRERRLLHGRTICWDELDMVGFWLKHGGFHWLTETNAGRIHVNPNYADIFDEIYAATHLGGPPVKFEITKPFIGDVRDMVTELVTQLKTARRNDPCPCGSGKKFKKCHGRPAG